LAKINSSLSDEAQELRKKLAENKTTMVEKDDLLCEKQNKVDQLQMDLIRLQNSTNVGLTL